MPGSAFIVTQRQYSIVDAPRSSKHAQREAWNLFFGKEDAALSSVIHSLGLEWKT